MFIKTKYKGYDVGVDGLILDIMRSRDSGTAPYISYYRMCLSKKIKSWNDLKPYFERDHYKLLKRLYRNVNDIEPMVGILLEKRRGNFIGKIGGCLVAEQFHRFKYGDRFFYSHRDNPHRFSKGFVLNLFNKLFCTLLPNSNFYKYNITDQLREIRKMTFAQLVCIVTDMGRVPRKGFVAVSKKNPYVDCKELKSFNLLPFKQNKN